MEHIIFYTQPNCNLCDDAKFQISFAQEDIDIKVTEVNIQQDDKLNELYCLSVPVLIDKETGATIQEGNVDFVTIIDYFQSKYK
ncbi:glutaredoxin family protein [Macrococcus epidermidis]|uniref:glutaredoxin family protein n=1 Tax=Macrococcus epidermidis TaxID=1902580 RepID=UPI001EF3B830|nr:glutaredoxin family protein [Macrococcus epidermidis]MCG7419427.1 glutaredoxin family protein [Macrococcus epidermidis]